MPTFGTRKLSAITRESIQTYVDDLGATELSPSTVRGIYAVLRTALGRAVRDGVIRQNPCTHHDLPRAPRQEMVVLTGEEVAALAEKIGSRYRVLIYTAAYCGLRAREALKDVRGHLEFGPTKTHERRTVQLPGFLLTILNDHLSQPLPGGDGPEALVFTSPTGLPLRHGLFYRRTFRPAVAGKAATKRRPAIVGALPPDKHAVRFHDLRHTCAALSIAAGAHPKLISARLGHSSITITLDRYVHLFPSVEAALAEALDAAFTGTFGSAPEPPGVDLATYRSSAV